MLTLQTKQDEREKLRALALQVSREIPPELMGEFLGELMMCASEESRREDQRQRQADGIAAAKARGVRFGRPRKTLPDNFESVVFRWRCGELSLRKASEACGMCCSSFTAAVKRMEAAESGQTA